MAKSKIYFIDNIKIALTALVILHHAVITYGGPGSWYYKEPNASFAEAVMMTIFCSVNQSFFMGLFFFLSALFLDGSYHSKGGAQFIIDRLVRLGIPLLIYSVILSPSINYIAEHFGRHEHNSFTEYMSGYHHWIDFGVMWFVAALLLFTIAYAVMRRLAPDVSQNKNSTAPENSSILLFAALAGIVSFLVRILFQVGWTLQPVGFQLGHFPQYLVAFYLGILVARNNWLESLAARNMKFWLVFTLLWIGLGFTFIFFLKTITDSPIETFSGGVHWQSLMYSLWEQVTGFSIVMTLLNLGRRKWNLESPFLKILSRSAYGAYIIHPILLVTLSVSITEWSVDPMIKLLIVAPLAVGLSFAVAGGFLKIPFVKKII